MRIAVALNSGCFRTWGSTGVNRSNHSSLLPREMDGEKRQVPAASRIERTDEPRLRAANSRVLFALTGSCSARHPRAKDQSSPPDGAAKEIAHSARPCYRNQMRPVVSRSDTDRLIRRRADQTPPRGTALRGPIRGSCTAAMQVTSRRDALVRAWATGFRQVPQISCTHAGVHADSTLALVPQFLSRFNPCWRAPSTMANDAVLLNRIRVPVRPFVLLARIWEPIRLPKAKVGVQIGPLMPRRCAEAADNIGDSAALGTIP